MPVIAVDAMGGDYAPGVVVEGARLALLEYGAEIVLVGQKEAVDAELGRYPDERSRLPVVSAPQVVAMDESPSSAIRKKESSLKIAFEMMKRGEAQAVVSAGNSGAMMAIGMFVVGTLPQVARPAILVVVPSVGKGVVIIDAGANVDCKPRQLLQFGIMGAVYAEEVVGIPRPRVGVLSNGEEESKGNELTRAASELLAASGLNYIGYVEGRDLFNGRVDVVVCDGFTGNVALKTMEGLAGFAAGVLQGAFEKNLLSKIGYLLSRGPLREAYRRLDYAEYGGAPLLGLNGVAIVAHGGSSPRAIKNAIRVAGESVSHDVNRRIGEALARIMEGEKQEGQPPRATLWQKLKSKIENLGERALDTAREKEKERGG
ncbi:MAG TPA: phosphate acyltransferase PlsX [candidate division Zixibacteria bacterium]|nr:phosphate acyltransferase PlsX [candidate division Zixibacteria bacterium]